MVLGSKDSKRRAWDSGAPVVPAGFAQGQQDAARLKRSGQPRDENTKAEDQDAKAACRKSPWFGVEVSLTLEGTRSTGMDIHGTMMDIFNHA